MIPTEQISALILAGGQGRRMGGQDKGWLHYRGRPLIEYALNKVKHRVQSILISANRSLNQYQKLGYPVIQDQWGTGPLAGILTGMIRAKTPYLMVIPCDMPLLPEDLMDRFCQSPPKTIAVAHDGQRWQYLVCLLPTALSDDLHYYLSSGGLSVRDWLSHYSVHKIDYMDKEKFKNFNYLEQLSE